jgi:heparosan-N-sulfate-glucuronate 5-epimerase
MLTGRSYWHVPQGLGCAFEPDKINGYFNDMTAKTTWTGLMNDTGIPVNVLSNGETVEIPTVIVQKALGHWDRWLIENDELHKSEFLKLCQWLLDNQDKQGGWDIWGIFGLKCSSKYSAMTQGEAISALLRAYLLTNNENYLEVGEKAVLIFRVPVSRGGITYFKGEDIF